MADFLTDDDIFGGGKPAKTAAPVRTTSSFMNLGFGSPLTRVEVPESAPGVLTDAEMFGGGPAKPAKAAKAEPAYSYQRPGYADLGQPPKWTPDMARNTTAAADLFTTGPLQMIADVFGQTAGRFAAGVSGASAKTARAFGKEYGAELASNPLIAQPLTRLFDWVTGQDPSKQTTVDEAMGKVTDLLAQGAKAVHRKTGIPAADVELVTEAFMAGLGGRAQQKFLGLVEKKVKPAAAKSTLEPEAAPDLETPPELNRRLAQAHQEAQAMEQQAPSIPPRASPLDGPQFEPGREGELRQGRARTGAPEEASTLPPSPIEGAPESGPETALQTSRRLGQAALDEQQVPTIPPLSSALAKLRAGQGLDLTAPERAAMHDLNPQFGQQGPKFRSSNFPKGRKQGGSASPELTRLIAGLGLGAGLAAYAYYNQDSFDGATLAVAAGSILGQKGVPRLALSSLLKSGDYTTKTLERLPQGATALKREQVLQQLNRADVSKAEKDLVLGVLGDKAEISANDLVTGFRRAAKNLELKPQVTDEYADYGLENLDRISEEQAGMQEPPQAGGVPSRTTVYQTPVELGGQNHFGDPNYFAHTRSFDENGVRHVVEIQSDVAQHAKTFTPAEQRLLEEKVEAAQTKVNQLQSLLDRGPVLGKMDVYFDAKEEMGNAMMRLREAQAALGPKNLDKVAPLLKTWYKRIIREEIANARPEPIGESLRHELAADDPERLQRLEDRAKQPVRFATADTVAKVEGWPNKRAQIEEHVRTLEQAIQDYLEAGGFDKAPWREEGLERARAQKARLEEELKTARSFSPEHQSIYDRYRGEIEKFLRNDLGGKPYTDPQGHTWIEVPASPRGPKQMFGRVDPSSLAALAAFVGGATAMHALSENPSIIQDVVAGLLAGAATQVSPRSVLGAIRSAKNSKPAASVQAAILDRDSNMRLAGFDTAAIVKRVGELVGSAPRREAIQTAIKSGNTSGLSTSERTAYTTLRNERVKLIQKSGLPAATVKKLLDAAEARSKDAAFVYADFANSLVGAAENERFLKFFKAQRTASGDLLVQAADKAPDTYEVINNPQLRGLRVHPEVASKLRFAFENPSAMGVVSAMEIIADVTKRSAVAASFFHVKALIDSYIGSMPAGPKEYGAAAVGAGAGYLAASALGDNHPGREAALLGTAAFVGRSLKSFATGKSVELQELAKGSSSAFLRRAVKAGLMVGSEKGALIVDDAGRRFYDFMKSAQDVADKIGSPVGIKAGKPIEAYVRANHLADSVMWGRIHPGMKLQTWSKTSEILRESSIIRNAKNPKVRILSEAEADSIAADFANDTFGGLNWTKIAMEAKTEIGRKVAEEAFSPRGRRGMRIAMFAPDWTISTVRAALAAVDKDLLNPLKWGNVAEGMFRPITRGDLARQYVARSALYYLVVGDAINYSMSGHHLWENDPKIGWSFIDWGDGRRMQFSKHIMETPHWFDHPVRQGVSKLGYVPKEVASQIFSLDYLYPRESKYGGVVLGPKMQDTSPAGRVEHALKGLEPIAVQSNSPEAAVWGAFGMPLFGRTDEEAKQFKREQRDRQRARRRKERK